jgi:hypothetical protein
LGEIFPNHSDKSGFIQLSTVPPAATLQEAAELSPARTATKIYNLLLPPSFLFFCPFQTPSLRILVSAKYSHRLLNHDYTLLTSSLFPFSFKITRPAISSTQISAALIMLSSKVMSGAAIRLEGCIKHETSDFTKQHVHTSNQLSMLSSEELDGQDPTAVVSWLTLIVCVL